MINRSVFIHSLLAFGLLFLTSCSQINDLKDRTKSVDDAQKVIISKLSGLEKKIDEILNEVNAMNFKEKKGWKEKIINEILDKPFINEMAEKYPTVDVSEWRYKYILYYQDRKNNIDDHRMNFEQWLLSFGGGK